MEWIDTEVGRVIMITIGLFIVTGIILYIEYTQQKITKSVTKPMKQQSTSPQGEYPKWEVKKLTENKHLSLVEFNDGYSHICVDDHCYMVVNGDEESGYDYSARIFPEAAQLLKELPDSPDHYEPYKKWMESL